MGDTRWTPVSLSSSGLDPCGQPFLASNKSFIITKEIFDSYVYQGLFFILLGLFISPL